MRRNEACHLAVLCLCFALSSSLIVNRSMAQDATAKPPATEPLKERVQISPDGKGFVLSESKQRFVPWGFNYDHDEEGRLIEDYWDAEWPKVEADFHEMHELGANVVRIHLQTGKFLKDRETPNPAALDKLAALVKLAEKERLYLDLTGLACYHKKDVPEWYDALSEADRWQAQCVFWQSIARVCRNSPAIFCYDLMNEPVVPGGKRKDKDWLGPPFAGKHFVQVITLDQADRPRPDIARAWINTLCDAIRTVDDRHLITVGMVDWSLDRPGLTSGFVPQKVADKLDFVCVHLYPQAKSLEKDLETLRGFDIGKPIVIEETFPLKCSMDEFKEFVIQSRGPASGWIGFYWGRTLSEYQQGKQIVDALMSGWLEFFQTQRPE